MCACGHRESEHYKHQDWYTCGDIDGDGSCDCDNFYPIKEPEDKADAQAKD
jgi:hypothetical protein